VFLWRQSSLAVLHGTFGGVVTRVDILKCSKRTFLIVEVDTSVHKLHFVGIKSNETFLEWSNLYINFAFI
jgi:hypothetical protein